MDKNVILSKKIVKKLKSLKEDIDFDEKRCFKEMVFMCKYDFLEHIFAIIDEQPRDKENNRIPYKENRVNSYLAYVLGITEKEPDGEFDPHLHCDVARVSHPDIDVDFESSKRDKIYDYLIEKYGRERTGNIGTFIGLQSKAAVKKTIKAWNPMNDKKKNLEFEEYVGKMINAKTSIQESIEEDEELQSLYNKYPSIFNVSKILEGIMAYPGCHPAGIVISDGPIKDTVPFHRVSSNKTYYLTTQYEMEELEECGLIKYDVLALKTLNIFDVSLKDIKNDLDIDIDINSIDFEDKKALKLISEGKTESVFQLESDGMKKLLKQMNVDSFKDVAASNALYRPGALAAKAHERYSNCKNGIEKPVYEHPKLKDILDETYGQIIYQEQCQLIARHLAGFSLKEADILRKGIGKKKRDVLEKLKEQFIEGSKRESQLDEKVANSIWKKLEDMGSYGFNQSHAYVYAGIALQCAYLKAHYPLYYMKGVLNSEIMDSDLDQVQRYLNECDSMGIDLLPPDINKSKMVFEIEGKALRLPFSMIKSFGQKAAKVIENNGKYNSFRDFVKKNCDESLINVNIISLLCDSGALKEFGFNEEEKDRAINDFQQLKKDIEKENKQGLQSNTMFDDFATPTKKNKKIKKTKKLKF